MNHRLGAFTLDARFTSEGRVTALFGRSGAGKTSLVNCLAGLIRPDRGRIVVDGHVLFDDRAGVCVPPHRRRIGYVFQEGRLFPHLTVRQNLLYGRWFTPHRERRARRGARRRPPRAPAAPRPPPRGPLRRREAARRARARAPRRSAPAPDGRAPGLAGHRAQGGDPSVHRAAPGRDAGADGVREPLGAGGHAAREHDGRPVRGARRGRGPCRRGHEPPGPGRRDRARGSRRRPGDRRRGHRCRVRPDHAALAGRRPLRAAARPPPRDPGARADPRARRDDRHPPARAI